MRFWRKVNSVLLAAAISAVPAAAIKVNKTELKLIALTQDNVPAYASVTSKDKILLPAATFVIVHASRDPATTVEWYRVDDVTPYERHGYAFFRPGEGVAVRPLEAIVVSAKGNIRELPSTSASVAGEVVAGDILTVRARTDQREEVAGFDDEDYWFEVATPVGVTGWVYGPLLGLLEPRGAYDRAASAIEADDPDGAIRVLRAGMERFPAGRFYHPAHATDDPHFRFLPTAQVMSGYAYIMKGDLDQARDFFVAALYEGDAPACAVLKLYDPDAEKIKYMTCDYDAATLARVGLGLATVKSDEAGAAAYLAQALADAESGLSTPNITPEYFDVVLVNGLMAMYVSDRVTESCLDRVAAALKDNCTYDFTPAYFLESYGEAQERMGKSSEALELYGRVVDEFPQGYLRDRGGYNTAYSFMYVTARALWRTMRIKTRLGETAAFASYAADLAEKNKDKRLGFLAYYAAGIALARAGDTAGAAKDCARAERYYKAGKLGAGDFGFYYRHLRDLLEQRRGGDADAEEEEKYFRGLPRNAYEDEY